MRRFLGLVICICLLFSGNCFAMQFSQPVKIGNIGHQVKIGNTGHNMFNPSLGIYINGAAYNFGIYDDNNKYNTKYYKSGLARFGNGKDALYLHYDMKSNLKFGGKDMSNTIEIPNKGFCTIYQIKSDSQLTFYILDRDLSKYIALARCTDGKFIKYIDMTKMFQKYLGERYNHSVYLKSVSAQEDTLIIKYEQRIHSRGCLRRTFVYSGTFYLKWNEKLQNFDVKHEEGPKQILNF